MIASIFAGAIGLAQGLLCGAAMCAVIRVLGIFKRVRSMLNSNIKLELFALGGMMLSTGMHLFNLKLMLPVFVVPLIGLGSGLYLGMMTASLVEITSILPAISRKLNVAEITRAAAVAWLIGNVTGSLLYWINPLLWQH